MRGRVPIQQSVVWNVNYYSALFKEPCMISPEIITPSLMVSSLDFLLPPLHGVKLGPHKTEPFASSFSLTTEREHWLVVECYF